MVQQALHRLSTPKPKRQYNGFDGVVGSDDGVRIAGGRFATVAEAIAELPAGSMIWIKEGSYAGFTASVNNYYIFAEPGTVFTFAIELSGTAVRLALGSQVDVQGILTLSGNSTSLTCEDGCTLDSIQCDGDDTFIDGGGWGTIVGTPSTDRNVIALHGNRQILQNISAQSTGGGGNSNQRPVDPTGTFPTVRNVRVIDSDRDAIPCSASDAYIKDCIVQKSDEGGIGITGPRARVIGNYVIGTGTLGIVLGSAGDNSVVVGNTVRSQAATKDAIQIETNGENCVVVGNRVDDLGTGNGIVDNSGTSTVADNDETAF